MYYCQRKPKNRKWGRPWNKARDFLHEHIGLSSSWPLEMQAMIQEVLEVSGLGCSGESTATQSSVSMEAPSWPTPSANDIVFRSSTSRYFCGQGRSDSPFGMCVGGYYPYGVRTSCSAINLCVH